MSIGQFDDVIIAPLHWRRAFIDTVFSDTRSRINLFAIFLILERISTNKESWRLNLPTVSFMLSQQCSSLNNIISARVCLPSVNSLTRFCCPYVCHVAFYFDCCFNVEFTDMHYFVQILKKAVQAWAILNWLLWSMECMQVCKISYVVQFYVINLLYLKVRIYCPYVTRPD